MGVGMGMGVDVDVDVGGFVGAFLGWLGEELKAHFVCVITERARVVIWLDYGTYCQLRVQIFCTQTSYLAHTLVSWLRI